MITVCVLGLDQYVVGHYSKEHTANLASLYEVAEDDVSFYAPNSVLIHEGVDQVSWNCLVIVRAPRRFSLFEEKIAHYILETLTTFCINVDVQFTYYDEERSYYKHSDVYPRFLTEKNVMNVEAECPEDEEAEDEPAEDVYLGNVFEGHEQELEALNNAAEEAAQEEACQHGCHHSGHHH